MKLTRRTALSLIVAAPTALRALAVTPRVSSSRVFLGTFTGSTGTTAGAKGIYTSTWDAASGVLSAPELAAATADPSFLARSAKLPTRLFAVNEMHGREGAATAFAISDQKHLKEQRVVNTGSEGPCHLALDHTGHALFVANYAGGSLSSYKVTSSGLSDAVSSFHFPGHSIDPDRQASAHTHCVRVSADNRFLLVNDLGLDRIMVFHIDPAAATLTPAKVPFWSATPGSGPRHSYFHPSKPWVYSVNELNSTIDMFDWDGNEGVLTHKATISSLPAEARGQKNAPAELMVDSSGRFLYMSNRFHDSISVFSIDQKDGLLTPVQDIPCGGKTPRFFTLDPSERWVLVANQDSRNISVFGRDSTTGKLTATGKSYVLDSPVCILFE